MLALVPQHLGVICFLRPLCKHSLPPVPCPFMAERKEPRTNHIRTFKGCTQKQYIICTHISLAKASPVDKNGSTEARE